MIYFNHNELKNRNRFNVRECLIEIFKMYEIIKKQGLVLEFYEKFWSIELSDCLLIDFIYSMDQDEVKYIITVVMNGGPWYYTNTNTNKYTLEIDPMPAINPFLEILFSICYKNKQKNILSLSSESMLFHDAYILSQCCTAHEINNIRGITCLNSYIKGLVIFKVIEDVFEVIGNKLQNIVILENARKSAKKHDFQEKYDIIYKTIEMVAELELQSHISIEKKQEEFKKKTGCEISGESQTTLSTPRYRREREFNIPDIGKKLFEWHIKIGPTIRIHYFVEGDKIYIGHCGRHLGIASYNS